MTTLLQLFNLALIRVGYTQLLTDATDVVSVPGILCNAVYEQTRDTVLRDYPWRFAKKRVALEESVVVPPDEWAFAYQVPTDCLKLRMLVTPGARNPTIENKIPFELMLGEGTSASEPVIFTDLENAELIYTSRIVDEDPGGGT